MAYHGKPLSAQHKQFVNEYLRNGGDGKAAAIAAGYTPGRAAVKASELLKLPNVADYVARRQRALAKSAQIDAERVVKELARVGFANIADVAEWNQDGVLPKDSAGLSRAVTAAIAAVEQTQHGVKVRMHGKNEALTTLARSLGMLKDNVNVNSETLDRLRAIMEADDGED